MVGSVLLGLLPASGIVVVVVVVVVVKEEEQEELESSMGTQASAAKALRATREDIAVVPSAEDKSVSTTAAGWAKEMDWSVVVMHVRAVVLVTAAGEGEIECKAGSAR